MVKREKQNIFLPITEDVCALIVTYHPDDDFIDRLERILVQVSKVFIVDNASNQKAGQMLQKLADKNNKVELILNNKNFGLAKALNKGMGLIKERGYQWVLILDQDTIPSKEQVRYLLEVYADCNRNNKIAIVGSNYYDIDNNKWHRFRYDSEKGIQWKERKTVITSGSLISMDAFVEIGPFRDDFYIDHVDHEFCLRARSKGFKVIVALKPLMQHTIGKQSIHRIIFFKIKTTNHSAQRNYFRSRNHVLLTREYFFKEPILMLKLLIVKIKVILVICIYEKDKLNKLKFIIRGYRDGIMRKSKTTNFMLL